MLTISAEPQLGTSIRDTTIPEMVALAERMQCRVKIKTNDITLVVSPGDMVADLQAKYDRSISRPVLGHSTVIASCPPGLRDIMKLNSEALNSLR